MTSITSEVPVRHAAPSVRGKKGLLAWLRVQWKGEQEASFDWTEPESEEPDVKVRPVNPQVHDPFHPPVPPAPAPTVHPPFAHRPATHTHVAIRMQRILVEASWDPDLTPVKLWNSLGPLVAELQSLVVQEEDQARRMDRNQSAAAAQRVLLEDAALRGVPDEVVVEQAAAGILGRAVHLAAERTGTMPLITEDMPDPRTVAQPRDESPGDVPESAESPVHDPGDPVPVPTQEFLLTETPQQEQPKPAARKRTAKAAEPPGCDAG